MLLDVTMHYLVDSCLIAGAEQGPWALEPGEHINAVEQVGD